MVTITNFFSQFVYLYALVKGLSPSINIHKVKIGEIFKFCKLCSNFSAKKIHKNNIQQLKYEAYISVTSTSEYVHLVHAAKPRIKAYSKGAFQFLYYIVNINDILQTMQITQDSLRYFALSNQCKTDKEDAKISKNIHCFAYVISYRNQIEYYNNLNLCFLIEIY